VEQKQLLNKWCWKNWLATCRSLKLDPGLSPYIKIIPKWIEDLNVRPEKLKLLQENIGKTLKDTRLDNYFLNKNSNCQE
jgi:hypothetical protein